MRHLKWIRRIFVIGMLIVSTIITAGIIYENSAKYLDSKKYSPPGEIEIFGEKLQYNSYKILKRIGSIIDYPVFYDRLTGRENLDIHCAYMGYYYKNAIDEVLHLVNLMDIDNKAVKNYSLGMKQRLGIARAIITKPEFLILDEPINGFDPIGCRCQIVFDSLGLVV